MDRRRSGRAGFGDLRRRQTAVRDAGLVGARDRAADGNRYGCGTTARLDAGRGFEWVTPPLPPGWTGLRPLDLLLSPTVVVRNSHIKNQFRQDRPIGPPDRELEGQRLEEAEKRRADEAQAS